AGSGSLSSAARLLFSITRPALSRPSSKEIQRSTPPVPPKSHPFVGRRLNLASLRNAFQPHSAFGGRGSDLAGSILCPRCGAANRPGTMFCSNCGSALAAGAGGMPPAPVPVYMGTPGLASPMEAERQTQISRKKTGILLLLVGKLIGCLRYIGLVG